MIELSDQNMATNPQCYKDREDYSRVDVVHPYSVRTPFGCKFKGGEVSNPTHGAHPDCLVSRFS